MARTITRVVATPPPQPGFIGEGHTAVEVVQPTDLAASDPFVLLMDDRLEIAERRQIGGPHPHAGLETVTLVLEGSLDDRDEGTLSAGDVLWMTAGRGIIHNEAVETSGRSRVLQLWIALPARERAHAPRFELIRRTDAPEIRAPGVTGRLYSGSTGALRSPTHNIVPITMLDLTLEPDAAFATDIPASYNGFVYVLDGDADIAGTAVARHHVGWLAPSTSSAFAIRAGSHGARIVLYAGEPTRDATIQYGPFVAGSQTEIRDLYRRFRAGQFVPMSDVARAQRAERRTA